jgi:hypothetical protein
MEKSRTEEGAGDAEEERQRANPFCRGLTRINTDQKERPGKIRVEPRSPA